MGRGEKAPGQRMAWMKGSVGIGFILLCISACFAASASASMPSGPSWDPSVYELTESEESIECEGDACQPLPPPPTDPVIGTTVVGPGNPPPTYTRYPRAGKKRCARRGKTTPKRRSCRARNDGKRRARR